MTSATTNTHETQRADPRAELGDAIAGAADTVQSLAQRGYAEARSGIPALANSTRGMIDEANQEFRRESDEMLAVGSAMSFGVACGLVIAGAPRLLVAAALVPPAMMTLTMYGRSRGRRH